MEGVEPSEISASGDLLGTRGALAFFAAQGMAGPAASKHPVFAGFGHAAPERGTSADADLAAPGPGLRNVPKLSEDSRAAMPHLLGLSKGEAAAKRAAQQSSSDGQAGTSGGSGGGRRAEGADT
ncbi:hypothetical protein ABPG77_010485 [Micractinium sp. CCAP 211/92]